MSAPHRGLRCHPVSPGHFRCHRAALPGVTANIVRAGVTRCHSVSLLSARSPLPPALVLVAFRLPLEMGEDVADALLLFRAEAVEGGLDLALHLRVADREAEHFDRDVLQRRPFFVCEIFSDQRLPRIDLEAGFLLGCDCLYLELAIWP